MRPGWACAGPVSWGVSLLRMIDANANRAREALRVLEDLARFVIDHAELQGRLKVIRHDFVQAMRDPSLDGLELLASRDSAGDIGTASATPQEYRRDSAGELAAANSARLTEALRAIEEAAKAVSAERAAREVERLRYRAYDIERDLRLALPTGKAVQWRVCVLLTEQLCVHHPWQRVAELAIEGGCDCLQLREKELESRELLARARRLVELANAFRARGRAVAIIINDRPDIALMAGATGVHLGQTDASLADVRRLAGSRLIIGVSCSTPAQASQAAREGADYLGLGPMFESSTKPKPALAGTELIRGVLADPVAAALPHLAISGITPSRMPQLVRAGVRGVAVSSAVCSAESPREAVEALSLP